MTKNQVLFVISNGQDYSDHCYYLFLPDDAPLFNLMESFVEFYNIVSGSEYVLLYTSYKGEAGKKCKDVTTSWSDVFYGHPLWEDPRENYHWPWAESEKRWARIEELVPLFGEAFWMRRWRDWGYREPPAWFLEALPKEDV